MTSKTTITPYGNVGVDPELRTIPGRQFTKEVYDPIIDDMVERDFASPEREVRTFSIAVSKRDPEGQEVTRWIRCDDWKRLSRAVGKGDRVKVQGHFRERSYEKDGETKTIRTIVVENLGIERKKDRQRAEQLGLRQRAASRVALQRVHYRGQKLTAVLR